jgi:hypothetical protein
MGFLDLLSGKKKDNSVPPPAAGPGKVDVPKGPNAVPPADSKQPEAPQKDVPKPGDAPKMPEAPSGPIPTPSGDIPPAQPLNDVPKPGSDNGQNVQAPPSPSQDMPKLELPTFPSGNMGNDFSIPTFEGKQDKDGGIQPPGQPGQEVPAPEAPKPQRSGIPQVQSQEAPTEGGIPQAPPGLDIPQPGQNPSAPQETPNAPTPGQEPGIPQVQAPAFNAPEQSQQPAAQEQSAPEQPQSQPSTKQWPAPNNYLNPDEQSLNDMKKQLHKPNEEVGTDASTIGNVQRNIQKKIRGGDSPLFIEINNYKRVLNSVDEIKRDLNESQEFVLKLDEFNDKKHNEFERWRKSFEYIQTKLQFVDKTLFKESHR